ncbi:MAG: class I SAM-dependent DNA methyltransferase [Polaromonas sp.]|uniref:class I SAM-dependent DNA methyltransferase n=1 Tax=Polaromonas sp. TaxID=1869339 RepID=UPI0027340B6A|nr:DNA methyltransferase [Polaromonas sp.]MDP3249491.1 class I SAM-dependent DNA methyltransferase [Polaromonas sp.]MDP3757423.1 class I SAM-dependent DNA methyltransferase [Polaromonas sp.]
MDDAQSKSDNDEQTSRASAFVERWQGVTASELSTAQSFVRELCELLGVQVPHATPEQDYMFERPVTFSHGDGSTSPGRIDCYRRGHFVLESKKLKSSTQTKGFDDALLRARAQAESYARALPPEEGRPPFLLVVDVGNVIELYSEFTRSGATYTPFPDPRSHRIALASLVNAEVRERLKTLWTDPDNLNPSRASARVTREVAGQLAELARSLEQSGHRADHVAAFLTRSLFSMFAEDVELLPKGSFLGLLQAHRAQPVALQQMLRVLWADMDRGGFSAALATQVLKFNGKLFKESTLDGYSLLLTQEQTDRLIRAAQANWREVEPAIFGTLLERALDPTERHALGAHYTPRAYVERLVLPTVVEPLRADWANVQAAALVLAREAAELSGKAQDAKQEEARAELRKFHHQLCTVRVLDPACGSGNFLYVTLEHLKRLEGEVINQLEALGDTQSLLGMEGETVTPQQLLGIELNDRAAALAELVLWIGYLQWHIRTRGNKAVAEPVVHDYGNIEHRDAVLAWDDTDLAYDENGQLLSRWDGTTFKAHPVTGALVPDEAAQVPQWTYIKPRQAEWPKADFIVGNPPFIGKRNMRAALGDGYVETLRRVWPDVPESADFVMYWWSRAAQTVRAGRARRFGLITTNSLRQTFNRRVVEAQLSPPPPKTTIQADPALVLVFAIADHPWVDSANGAAVRIAMTVAGAAQTVWADPIEASPARLLTVTSERVGQFGEMEVTLDQSTGMIQADLSIGANLDSAVPLQANLELSNIGVIPLGSGFIVSSAEAGALSRGLTQDLSLRLLRRYRNGRDLTDSPRDVFVIDTFGFDEERLREDAPAIWQWLHDRVKPERDQNARRGRRENWWRYGEDHPRVRRAIKDLPRYIVTVMTSKHRTFQFIDGNILPDQKLVVFGLENAFTLGVLSSELHVKWSVATGSTLEDRPVYVKTTCFETFPLPDEDTGLTPALRQHIAALAEQIDAHRKRQQAAHPGLSLTGMYNVLEALREGRELTAKEKAIHTQGLVSVLKDLHDELDTAVLQAYGLEPGLSNDALLTQLVALNARRAAEEKTGRIRWLRPEFQNPAASKTLQNQELPATDRQGLQAEMALENEAQPAAGKTPGQTTQPWPASLPAQVRALAEVLSGHPAALTVAEIEARFKGRGPWKKSLPRILETLEALGRARRDGESWRE